MKLAGMLAALLVSAAQSQTPSPDLTPLVELLAEPAPAAASAALPATPAHAAPPTTTVQAATPVDAASTPAPAAPPIAQPATPADAAVAPAAARPVAPDTGPTATSPTPQSTAPDTAPTAASPTPQSTAPDATPHSTAVPPVGEAVPRADLAQATTYLKSAVADFTTCRRPSACNAYFDTFGIAISFADGSISPFSHVQRLATTSRECVKKAKALEEEGNRSMAVQWAMAAKVENRTARDWLGNHPDAVLAALRQVSAP